MPGNRRSIGLWDYYDVRTQAEEILERRTEGSCRATDHGPRSRSPNFAAGLKPGCPLSAHVESAPLHLASRKLDRSSDANDT